MKKEDFDYKLKSLNKNVTSDTNEWNELPEKLKAISKKVLIKDLINKFSIFNRAKYFSSRIFHESFREKILEKRFLKKFTNLFFRNIFNVKS